MTKQLNPKTTSENFIAELFSVSGWLMFLLALTASFLNVYLVQEYVLTDEVYHNTLGERLAYDRIEKMLSGQRAYSWVGYVFVPVSVLLQVLAITICFMAGVVLSFAKISFKQVFKITLVVVAVITVLRLVPTLVLLLQDITVMDDLLTSDWYSLLALFGRDYAMLSFINPDCEHCRYQTQVLFADHEQRPGDLRLAFITDVHPDSLKAFASKFDYDTTTTKFIWDKEGKLAQEMGVTSYPTMFLYDTAGIHRQTIIGEAKPAYVYKFFNVSE